MTDPPYPPSWPSGRGVAMGRPITSLREGSLLVRPAFRPDQPGEPALVVIPYADGVTIMSTTDAPVAGEVYLDWETVPRLCKALRKAQKGASDG